MEGDLAIELASDSEEVELSDLDDSGELVDMGESKYTEEHLGKIDLAREHTRRLIALHTDAIQRLDTKFASGIGISGLFLKFASELCESSNMFTYGKIIAMAGFTGCAVTCLCGLFPQTTGKYMLPSEIVEERFNDTTQSVIDDMLGAEIETEGMLKKLSSQKTCLLKAASLLLVSSITITGLSQIASKLPI